MTVVGDELVKNCRHCYSNFGFGVRLINDGGQYNCPNCKSRYVLEHGFTKRV
ncbi:MAG TPA: hypothetical protein VJI13_00690 [Candidatus Norongarragalinales archaeon]|nr:hypothetical protein [Candidatus Norongarragalinales archaeon]